MHTAPPTYVAASEGLAETTMSGAAADVPALAATDLASPPPPSHFLSVVGDVSTK